MEESKSVYHFEKFGIAVAGGFLVFSLIGVFQAYAVYRKTSPTSEVLGEKISAVADYSCIDKEKMSEALTIGERTVTFYAPDKTVVLPLKEVVSCISIKDCAEGVACSAVAVNVDSACLLTHFTANPLAFTTTKIIQGKGISAQVKIEDWVVNYGDLSLQLADAIGKEVSYCQLTGEEKLPKKNIANIQITVTDSAPAMDTAVAKRFIEIDRSKLMLYFWNDGVYQSYMLNKGARLPTENILTFQEVDLAKLMQSIDYNYVKRNSAAEDYIVIHE